MTGTDDPWPTDSPGPNGRIVLLRFLTSIPAALLGLLSGVSTMSYWQTRTDPAAGHRALHDLPVYAGFALTIALGSVLVLLPAVLARAWKWWVLLPGLLLAATAGYDLVLPIPHP